MRESARVGSYVRLLHVVLLTLCCVCQFELARRQFTELWEHKAAKDEVEKYAMEACKYQVRCSREALVEKLHDLAFVSRSSNLVYCISSLTTAPLPSLLTPNALQSSCNLTKQAHAVKSKKSLNIIHIGNICKFPHKRTL